MSEIFVSYRRSDSSAIVGRVIDRLEAEFGEEGVFRDLEKIDYGDDFGEVIVRALSECRVMLAVIGREWEQAEDDTGQRRIDDPEDWVRREISRALQLGIPVIPVLVENAKMPPAASLPDELKPLAKRNGAKVRDDPDFDGDIAKLCRAVRKHVRKPLSRRQLLAYVTGLVTLGFLCVAGYVWYPSLVGPSTKSNKPRNVNVTFEDKTTGETIMRSCSLTYVVGDKEHTSQGFAECEVLAGGVRNVKFATSGVGYGYDREDQTKLNENTIVMRRLQLSPRTGPGQTFADSILPEEHPMDDVTVDKKFDSDDLSADGPVSPFEITFINKTTQHIDLVLIRSDTNLRRAIVLPVCRPDGVPVTHEIPDTKPGGFYFIYASRNARRAEYLHQDILHGAFETRMEITSDIARKDKLRPSLQKLSRSTNERGDP